MERKTSNEPYLLKLVLFIIIVIVNWAYVFLVQSLSGIIINSWFVLFPFISLLYLFCSLIAMAFLYLRNNAGLTFVYTSIMFGTLSSALSYSLIYKSGSFLVIIFPYLIIINLCFVLYIAYCNRC